MIWNLRGPKTGPLSYVLGGWTVSPIITVQSGIPFSVLQGTGGDRDFDGSTIGDRPDIGNPNAPVNTRAKSVAAATCSTGFQNIDTLACVTTNDVHFVLANGGNQPVLGRVEGRNANYTPFQAVADANIIKTFKLTERWKFEYRAEIFNVSNTRNVVTPSTRINVNTTAAGQFINYNLQNLGLTAQGNAVGSRIVRMGLKVIF
jgi:hypothetical protein